MSALTCCIPHILVAAHGRAAAAECSMCSAACPNMGASRAPCPFLHPSPHKGRSPFVPAHVTPHPPGPHTAACTQARAPRPLISPSLYAHMDLQWYFGPISPARSDAPQGGSRALRSLGHALGPSLGSLCLGSAILTLMSLLRQVRMASPVRVRVAGASDRCEHAVAGASDRCASMPWQVRVADARACRGRCKWQEREHAVAGARGRCASMPWQVRATGASMPRQLCASMHVSARPWAPPCCALTILALNLGLLRQEGMASPVCVASSRCAWLHLCACGHILSSPRSQLRVPSPAHEPAEASTCPRLHAWQPSVAPRVAPSAALWCTDTASGCCLGYCHGTAEAGRRPPQLEQQGAVAVPHSTTV